MKLVIRNQKGTIMTTNKTYRSILNQVRGLAQSPVDAKLGAYAAHLMTESGGTYETSVAERCEDDELRRHLLDNSSVYEPISNALATFPADSLREYVLDSATDKGTMRFAADYTTFNSMAALAHRILDIKDEDRVADLCCGVGCFLSSTSRETSASFYGMEANRQVALVARAKAALLDNKFTVETGDVLTSTPKQAFDKVFSDLPLNMRTANFTKKDGLYDLEKICNKGYGFIQDASWLFAIAANESLAEGGRALLIMTIGALSNGTDYHARRRLVENHCIKSVIALPSGIVPGTNAPVAAVLLEKNEDYCVRMVDATDLAVPGRRWDTLGEVEIGEIMRRLDESSDKSRLVTWDELTDITSLAPSRYLGREVRMANPTPLGDVATAIDRGILLPASKLDELATTEETRCRYLKLSDIEDGIIGNDLTRLREIDPKAERHCLRNGDLVVSKNGSPFKVAVAETDDETKIAVNGNAYIVRLDPQKADPYYVAAFLVSEDGKATMAREATGTTVPGLPLANLRRMEIPLPSLAEQQRIGETYRRSLDRIRELRRKLESAREHAASVYTRE